MNRIFVYGTLLRGESNHSLLEKARFIRQACTPPQYDLVDLDDYPALVAGGVSTVRGELYDVTDAELEALDVLEECPDHYQRLNIELDDGEIVMAYLLSQEQTRGRLKIDHGDWRSRRAAKPQEGSSEHQ